MASECYRWTTLGRTLRESLMELTEDGRLPPALVEATMRHFDRCMGRGVREQAKLTLSVRSGRLHTYRLSEDVCTFLLTDVEFWHPGTGKHMLRAPVAKIMAWEAEPAEKTERCKRSKRRTSFTSD